MVAKHDNSYLGARFRLLDLPDEIWSRICRLAVSDGDTILLKDYTPPKVFAQAVSQPPITRVCRVIREETLGQYYLKARIKFITFRNADILLEWLRALQRCGVLAAYRPNIKVVCWYSHGNYANAQLKANGFELRA
ncbi:hypothetical protein LTR97_011487 [Elasticomyces elasticus]|uniref:Uncharacterized protein n=1 Tax=Elasticomyces elasticus TaxID=574655 RepID=A0AAN7VMQ0_9PEZI|nr:hypothetical protein LTR97_011487 [Elasticomyces elasticus]